MNLFSPWYSWKIAELSNNHSLTHSLTHCVATFKQHLHMEYIYLSWYDIPEIVVPIVNSLITRKLLNQGILVVKLKSSLRKFYGSHRDLVNRYGISVSQMATAMLLFSIQNIVPSKSTTCHRHFYKTNSMH